MPPKKGKKSKKGPKEEPEVLARDFTRIAPLDGLSGAVGIEHVELKRKVDSVKSDLLSWKVAQALESGSRSLVLSGLHMHELPEETFTVEFLQEADLSNNFLTNGTIGELTRFGSLRALNLATNFLAGTLPDEIGDLRKLQEVELDDNLITALPPTMGQLLDLTVLTIRNNRLVDIPSVCLASWPRLVHLDLRGNKLTSLPAELGACLSLERLLLTDNKLTELPESLGSLASLVELQAANNELTAIPAGLGACSRLQVLHVGNNKISDLSGEVIRGLPRLRVLHAYTNKLTSIPAEIGDLADLEVLTIANNAIKDIPEALGGCTKMRQFFAQNNGLTSVPASLASWTVLREASFKGNKLKALPDELSLAWAESCRYLDVTSKGKKPSCKLPAEFNEAMPKTRIVGFAVAKKKKGKAKK